MKADLATETVPGGGPAACLKVEEVARLIGCARHAVPVLVRSGLLQPLGNPRANATKYFQTEAVMQRCRDGVWLSQAIETIRLHWGAGASSGGVIANQSVASSSVTNSR